MVGDMASMASNRLGMPSGRGGKTGRSEYGATSMMDDTDFDDDLTMAGFNAGGPIRLETDYINLDVDHQKIPKVTRHLPHIRQPRRRDRDADGVFTAFVFRQYLPQFFSYI